MPSEQLNRGARPVALAALVLGLLARPAAAQVAARDAVGETTRMAVVTYVAGGSIYVGAGRDDGLTEGGELAVVRGGSPVATLRVAFLSSRQASCEVVNTTIELAVGDSVRYVPVAAPDPSQALAGSRPPSRRLSGGRGPGLHGRVGARYLVAGESQGGGFSQPSADLRLQASELGGIPLGLALDLRTRRTTRERSNGPAEVDGRTRVYRAALLWHDAGAPFRLVLGRQYLSAVTSVSLFDGALAEVNGSRFGAGVFGGVEPEPVRLGLSSEVQDFGGYLQVRGRQSGASRWQVTSGAVGSYRGGRANREFLYAQASLTAPGLTLSALQEVDYYRPWKVAQGEEALSPTSTYLSASLRPARWLGLRGAYDTRRQVRLYRDAIDPATAFDDSFRKGASAGVTVGGGRLRLSGDLHRSSSETGGDATAYTATLGANRMTPLHLGVTLRTTWYDNTSSSGHLETVRVGADPWPALHLDWSLGSRSERDPLADPARRRFIWYGLDADLGIGRAWYLSFSGQRESGPGSTSSLLQTSLSWRF